MVFINTFYLCFTIVSNYSICLILLRSSISEIDPSIITNCIIDMVYFDWPFISHV